MNEEELTESSQQNDDIKSSQQNDDIKSSQQNDDFDVYSFIESILADTVDTSVERSELKKDFLKNLKEISVENAEEKSHVASNEDPYTKMTNTIDSRDSEDRVNESLNSTSGLKLTLEDDDEMETMEENVDDNQEAQLMMDASLNSTSDLKLTLEDEEVGLTGDESESSKTPLNETEDGLDLQLSLDDDEEMELNDETEHVEHESKEKSLNDPVELEVVDFGDSLDTSQNLDLSLNEEKIELATDVQDVETEFSNDNIASDVQLVDDDLNLSLDCKETESVKVKQPETEEKNISSFSLTESILGEIIHNTLEPTGSNQNKTVENSVETQEGQSDSPVEDHLEEAASVDEDLIGTDDDNQKKESISGLLDANFGESIEQNFKEETEASNKLNIFTENLDQNEKRIRASIEEIEDSQQLEVTIETEKSNVSETTENDESCLEETETIGDKKEPSDFIETSSTSPTSHIFEETPNSDAASDNKSESEEINSAPPQVSSLLGALIQNLVEKSEIEKEKNEKRLERNEAVSIVEQIFDDIVRKSFESADHLEARSEDHQSSAILNCDFDENEESESDRILNDTFVDDDGDQSTMSENVELTGNDSALSQTVIESPDFAENENLEAAMPTSVPSEESKCQSSQMENCKVIQISELENLPSDLNKSNVEQDHISTLEKSNKSATAVVVADPSTETRSVENSRENISTENISRENVSTENIPRENISAENVTQISETATISPTGLRLKNVASLLANMPTEVNFIKIFFFLTFRNF